MLPQVPRARRWGDHLPLPDQRAVHVTQEHGPLEPPVTEELGVEGCHHHAIAILHLTGGDVALSLALYVLVYAIIFGAGVYFLCRMVQRGMPEALPEARPDARRPEWPDDPVAGCRLDGVVLDAETRALREDLLNWMREMSPEPAHYGMVHGDFERTNFLLHGGSIGLFDFDDCCRHWFIWDIACAMWVFRNATAGERTRILGWFLEGYAAVREPDSRRMEHFSEVIRLRTVALLLHRLRRPAGLISAADRDWMARTGAWLHSRWSW